MQRMRVYKPPSGIAVFEVKRDRSVVIIDMLITGVRVSQKGSFNRFDKQYEIIQSTLKALGLNFSSTVKEEKMVLKYGGRIVLCILYYSESGIVKNATIAGFSPGVLAKLSRKFEVVGWKKIALFELKPATRAHV
ncbi:MAG: hypothetical protein NZ954_08020 [Thermofilaceae archaeon]|nr:hypothetical protein [Thermofilaceae archaeon]MCX8180230.1 hypothetical protein [Thermofilaceae archaeon]MDW8003620.1 hypothetical protein [Thermofilaceae archaeon]